MQYRIFTLVLFWFVQISVVLSEENVVNYFAEIKMYAELSSAVYEEKAALSKVIENRKFSLHDFANIAGVEVSYAIVSNHEEKQHIVVVRGTANVENAIVDMKLKFVPDELTGIKLHQGFLQAAAPIFQNLKAELNRDYDISTTGHSLGGAVAVILAMQLHSDGFNINKVFTFGQPKVTNLQGAKKYQFLNLVRLVKPKDLVPIVPPLDPVDVKNLDIYWHLGKEVMLMGNNEYAELEGLKSMLRSAEFLTTVPNEENLEHHKMSGYMNAINSLIEKATRIEHSSSFNPLNLLGN